MTKKCKLPILLILILALTVSVLVACGSVEIESISVKAGSVYKREYVVGEEFDLTGIELVVLRTDGESQDVMATDVRQDIKIYNFSTAEAVQELSVIIDYKGKTTNIVISVKAREDATTKYVVSFETGHGSEVESVGANEFETIPRPEDPVRLGYAFDGWYKQPTYNDMWNFDVDKVQADTVLYAKWSQLYTFTFRNNYKGIPDNLKPAEGVPDIIKTVKAGDTLSDIPAVPQIQGFVGKWERESFIAIDNIVVEAEYEVSLFDVNFYYFASDGVTPVHLVTFKDVPYGTNLAVEKADEIAAIDVPEFTEDGTRHFDSWDKPFTNIVTDLDVFARYVINEYAVKFDLNDGSGNLFHTEENIKYNNPVSAPTAEPTREGYEFDGWYKQKEGLTRWNFNTDRVQGEMTLYAKWIQLHYVRFLIAMDVEIDETVEETFVVEEGGVPVTYRLYREVAVRNGGNVNKPQAPLKTGYTGSWFIEDAALQNISQSLNVKAVFDINYYTVRFFNYDYTEVGSPQKVAYNTAAIEPAHPTRVGYTFNKWDKDFSAVSSDLEVIATFNASEYLVNIVPNNGTSNYTVSALYDSRIVLTKELNYDGYHFDGWYTDSIYSPQNKWNIASDALQKVGDGALTLYAKWRKIHTILFLDENNSQTANITVLNEEFIENVPEIPQRVGYTGNWYKRNTSLGTLESTPFDFTQSIISDAILVLSYTKNVYPVTFYRQSQDTHAVIYVEHGEFISVTITEPTLEGKTFVNWGIEDIYSEPIVGPTYYLARFIPIMFNVTWAVSNWGLSSDIVTSVEYGTVATYPLDAKKPTQIGHSLVGWICQAGDQDINSIKADCTFVPDWEINSYTIDFKDKETNAIYPQIVGSGQADSQRKEYGRFFDVDGAVPNPQKEGKDFVGWQIGDRTFKYSVDLNAWIMENNLVDNQNVYAFSGATVSLIIKGDLVYYTFEPISNIPQYLLNWHSSTSKILPLTATESGWYGVDNLFISNAKTIAFSGHLFYEITADTTFLSNHVNSTYTVSYVSDLVIEGLTDDVYEYGKLSVEPVIPAIEDYAFLGWFTDSSLENNFKYTFGTAVTEDITLYAKWQQAREYTEDNGITYSLNENGTYSLTAVDASVSGKVIVANIFNGKIVDSIGKEAFAGNQNVTSIDLPDTLVSIGPGAFMNMAKLKSISIPFTVETIPDNAFSGSSALEVVDFGDVSSVKSIGTNAFAKTGIKYSAYANASLGITQNVAFKLPEGLKNIGNGAFYKCEGLTEIYIPDSVLTIGDNAFADAINIRFVTFRKNAPANIGKNVFKNATALQDAFRIYVPIGANYTRAANDADNNWSQWKDNIYGLDGISIIYDNYDTQTTPLWTYRIVNAQIELIQYLGKDSVVVVGKTMAISKRELLPVSIIGNYAFDTNTVSVEFNASTGISEYAFDTAENLTSLTISVDEGIGIISSYLSRAYNRLPKLNTLKVSPTVTVSELFGGAAPTSLTIVKTLTGNISQNFLANCIYVQEVEINGTAETIGNNAFMNCTSLREVRFTQFLNPNNNLYEPRLTTIGANAFSGALSLASFKVLNADSVQAEEIPLSVTSIGEDAFKGTKWISENSKALVIIGNGILYHYNAKAKDASDIVVIPENVISITVGAFAGNTSIKQVYVENIASARLSSIGARAFENCVNLESVILPQSISSIGDSAFSGATKLATLLILAESPNANSVMANSFEGANILKIYAPKSAVEGNKYSVGNWSLFNIEGVENARMIETAETVTTDDAVKEYAVQWVVSDTDGGVKVLKVITASPSLTVPSRLEGKDVKDIADYCFPRSLTHLSMILSASASSNKAFSGVTNLKTLTLDNQTAEKNLSVSALKELVIKNTGIATINLNGQYSVVDLIGTALPQNIKTVNILKGMTIAEEFLLNNEYVENIYITKADGTLVKLEETIADNNGYVTVGARAFRNTKWMQNYLNDYIVVLGGNLVDYKGMNSVLSIPSEVSYDKVEKDDDGNIINVTTLTSEVIKINDSIFEDDTFIEIVEIPATVDTVGENAFSGATKLTKIILNGTVSNVKNTSFNANDKVEIFVPSTNGLTGVWENLNLKSKANFVSIKNKVLEYVSGNKKIVDYKQYMLDSAEGVLFLSRAYRETYSITKDTQTGEDIFTLISIQEASEVEAPSVVEEKAENSIYTYQISKIGNNVFMSAVNNVSFSTSVVLEQGVFANLDAIEKITLLDSEIEYQDKEQLRMILLTHSVNTIAFSGAKTLTDVLYNSDEVKDISSLPVTSIEIIDGTTATVDYLLQGWVNINSVKFPSSITRVGKNSLEDTDWYLNYTSLTYGNDFVVLGGVLLYKYKGISNATVVIPREVDIVNVGAFSTYNLEEDTWSSTLGLNEIRFENGSQAHSILEFAFKGNRYLANISLPSTMSVVEASAFEDTAFAKVDDTLIVSGKEQGATLVKYFGNASSYTLPSNIMHIAAGAFKDNKTLTSFSYDTINGSMLRSIREEAFYGAENLVNLELPNSVTVVGEKAFHNTKWFGEQLLENQDVMVGGILYQALPKAVKYSVTDAVTSITKGAFNRVESFTIGDTTYPDANYNYVTPTELSINNGVILPAKDIYNTLYGSAFTTLTTNGQIALNTLIGVDEPLSNITTLNFHNTITEIAAGYAEGWTNVVNVGYISSSVQVIGENAFRGTTWFENYATDKKLVLAYDSGIIINYRGTDETLSITDNVKGFTADAFRGNETIKSLIISNQTRITEIPAYAFMDCINLREVTLNEEIVEFGEKAFYNTAWLNNYQDDFTIINGVMISYNGTYTEENGGEIIIPKETKKIYPYVFQGNTDITSVIFHENCLITEIGADMFRDCINLENITLNEHIIKVDRSALQGTKWLEIVSQGTAPVLSYESKFLGIKRIVLFVGNGISYRIPSDYTEIMPSAFQGVESLVTLTFQGTRINEIPANAFTGCTSLATVVMPNDMTVVIGANAFEGTPWLNNLLSKEQAEEEKFAIKNGNLIGYNGTNTEIVLPASVASISQGVFTNINITSIDMSLTSITEIPENAFTGLINLKTVIFSASLNRIGAGAFSGTKFLLESSGMLTEGAENTILIAYNGASGVVTIPSSITYINSDVFNGNANVTGLVLQGEIEICKDAFVGTSLQSVEGEEYIVRIGENAFSGTAYENGKVSNDFVVIGGNLVSYVGNSTEITIPNGVTYIPDNVFNGSNITALDFSEVEGNGVLEIAPNAFRNAVNLKEIVWNDAIKSIGSRAFYNTAWYENRNLNSEESLIITQSGKLLAYIGENTSVSIPSRVTSFADKVFQGNTTITNIAFELGTAVNIPSYAFSGCSSLINVTFPSVKFTIGEKAFEGTAWLREQKDYVVVNGMLIEYQGNSSDILIPANVTSIYSYVFKGNETITSLSFANGSALKSITGDIFEGCTSLNSVNFGTALEHLEVSAFKETAWLNNKISSTDWRDKFIAVGTVGAHLLAYIGEGGSVMIPANIGTISSTAFQGNTTITEISLENGSYLTSISKEAFKGCVNLEKVEFLEETSAADIVYVGKNAFEGTAWLLNVMETNINVLRYNAFILKNKLLFYLYVGDEDPEPIFFTVPKGITYIAKSMFEETVITAVDLRGYDPTGITLAEGALDSIGRITVDAEYAYTLRQLWPTYAARIVEG